MKIPGLLVVTALAAPAAETPDVAQIMGRVGVNRQKARDARESHIYRQVQLLPAASCFR
jgi:hypothetical protein